MRFSYLLIFVLVNLNAFAQNNELLRSRSILPSSVIGNSQQRNSQEIKKRSKRNETISSDQYTLIQRTSELCQKISESGRLMVNDTMSSYANKILDVLLKDSIELRNQLQVYFYYSTDANVITLDNGMIIVELGMLAHVQSEAQLAFILSHEIGHYREHHFLRTFRFAKNASSSDDPLREILGYSRELEQEADSVGFTIFKKSGYAISESLTVFDILKNCEMPESQIPFSQSFFEHADYQFPSSYAEDSLVKVETPEYDENQSTHPSCENRMDKIQALITDNFSDGQYYLVSESVFNELRRIAREECCTIYLEGADFCNAIYCSYALIKENGSNEAAQRIIGKSLYNIAANEVSKPPALIPEIFIYSPDYDGDFRFESSNEIFHLPDYEKIQGESQRLCYFLDKLDAKEMAILALDWNWRLYQQSQYKDSLLYQVCNNLFKIIPEYYELRPSDFYMDSLKNKVERIPVDTTYHFTAAAVDTLMSDSLKKILSERVPSSLDSISSQGYVFEEREIGLPFYCSRAFVDFANDNKFKSCFSKYVGYSSPASEITESIWYRSNSQRYSHYGLGIDSLYVLQPEYYRFREIQRTKKYRYKAYESDQLQKIQEEQLQLNMAHLKGNFKLITPNTMDSTKVADYNTFCLLQQWISERFYNSNNSLAMNLAHAEIGDSLAKKFGTRYLMVSTIVSEKQSRIRRPGTYILACVFPYTLPIALIYGLIPKNRSRMQTFVFDLKTGEMVMYYEDIIRSKAAVAKTNSYYSKVLHKISAKKEVQKG